MAYPMESAPQNGEVIEALFEGDWLEVYWSDRAYDGSPYGAPGWAQSEGGYLILDLEAWRPILDPVEYGDPSPLQGHRLRQPIVVLGLGFGDESKGATVDYLSATIPDATAVVRWSGGANAAHNVRHGHRHHTFRQFGSGSFLGLPTLLTERVVVNPQILMAEAVDLEDLGVHNPLSLMAIHGEALVTTPIHMALNRAREILRGSARHGSCGLGIGETIVHGYAERNGLTIADSVGNFEMPGNPAQGEGLLTMGMLLQEEGEDIEDRIVTILNHQARYAAPLISEAKAAVPELADELFYGSLSSIAQELIAVANSVDVLSASEFRRELSTLMGHGTVIFEGSQGVLLDEKWGFHPHTTWAQTEPSELVNSLNELGHQPYILGLTRSYSTRHGEGPLPSQDTLKLTESMLPADDNSWGRWQGDFRVAPLDLPLLSYSQRILLKHGISIDGLSISHLDAFEDGWISLISHYDGNADPSSIYEFRESAEPRFPTMNSDKFLKDSIASKVPTVTTLVESLFFDELSARLSAPVVLTARGPKRTDRSLDELSSTVMALSSEVN